MPLKEDVATTLHFLVDGIMEKFPDGLRGISLGEWIGQSYDEFVRNLYPYAECLEQHYPGDDAELPFIWAYDVPGYLAARVFHELVDEHPRQMPNLDRWDTLMGALAQVWMDDRAGFGMDEDIIPALENELKKGESHAQCA